jgi:hypothetical protein
VDLENAIRQVIASDEYQASLPRPVEPPAFRLRKPEKGQGRFRKSNESIGIADRIATEVFLLDGRSLAESGTIDRPWTDFPIRAAVRCNDPKRLRPTDLNVTSRPTAGSVCGVHVSATT